MRRAGLSAELLLHGIDVALDPEFGDLFTVGGEKRGACPPDDSAGGFGFENARDMASFKCQARGGTQIRDDEVVNRARVVSQCRADCSNIRDEIDEPQIVRG